MLRSLKKKKLGKRNIDFFNIMHVVMKKHGMKNIKEDKGNGEDQCYRRPSTSGTMKEIRIYLVQTSTMCFPSLFLSIFTCLLSLAVPKTRNRDLNTCFKKC